jgi:hypothetical protein
MKNLTKLTVLLAVVFIAGCSKNGVSPANNAPAHQATQRNDALTAALVIPPSGVAFSAVTIVGTNFSPVKTANHVFFNGVAGVVNYASTNLIVATVPQNATTGKITVITGINIAISANDFKVLQMVADGSVPQEAFVGVSYMAFDKSGNAYGITNVNTQVFKYVNGTGSIIYTTPAVPRASLNKALIYTLNGIVADGKGNVYVTQNYYNQEGVQPFISSEILKIKPDGTVSVFAGGTVGMADGNGATAKFNQVDRLAIDGFGNIYAGDIQNSALRKITPDGHVSTLHNTITPFNITADSLGNVYYNDEATIQHADILGNISNIANPLTAPNYIGFGSMLIDHSVLYVVHDNTAMLVINAAGYVSDYSPGVSLDQLVKDDDNHFYNVVSNFIVPSGQNRDAIFRYIFK